MFCVIVLLLLQLLLFSYGEHHQKIDYFVRTTHKDVPYLQMLFRSFETFSKLGHGCQFFVIFDGESNSDQKASASMPKWTTVVFEPLPNVTFTNVLGAGMHDKQPTQGWSRSQYSNFHIDQYGSAPYVGILDADSMIKAHCGEAVSFFNETGAPRIFCTQHRDLGLKVPRNLDPNFAALKPWCCMDSFPFIFRRDDLPKVRQWFIDTTKTSSFDEAYNVVMSQMKNALDFGQFALLGAWAFTYNKDNYAFAIGGNGPYSTCPELRVGIHVPYSYANYMNYPKLSDQYFLAANLAMFEGKCYSECGNASEACALHFKSSESANYMVNGKRAHMSLMSLEGQGEGPMKGMFGGSYDKPLYKAECKEHLVKIYDQYDKCLSRRCDGLLKRHYVAGGGGDGNERKPSA